MKRHILLTLMITFSAHAQDYDAAYFSAQLECFDEKSDIKTNHTQYISHQNNYITHTSKANVDNETITIKTKFTDLKPKTMCISILKPHQ